MKNSSEGGARKFPCRIVLIDDHPILRQGLSQLLGSEKDFAVCGQFEDAPSALEGVSQLKPDVAIVDISLKGSSGLELIKNIKAMLPEIVVLVLSMHDETLYAERALRAGASGYVMKHESPDQLLLALRQVIHGEVHLSSAMNSRLMLQFISGKPSGGHSIERLTDRELEIFNLIGAGQTTRDIAAGLQLSVKTVETHRSHIKEKLSLKNSTELVHCAVRLRPD